MRWLTAVLAAAVSCLTLIMGVPSRASAAALVSATWTASKTTTGAVGIAYTYTLTTRTTATLSKVTMTVPSGTGGVPALGPVTGVTAAGTLSQSGTTLSYTFAPVSVMAGTVLAIAVTGLTNTSATGSQSSAITTYNGAAVVDTGTAAFTFTGTALTGVTWATSSTVVGAPASYTYTFTPSSTVAALATLTMAMTVPPGTSGTPVIGAVTPPALLNQLNGISLSGTTLTVTGTAGALSLGTPVSITVNGLINTYAAGRYVPEIVTSGLLGLVDSGVAPGVTFPGALAFAAPGALSWRGMLTGGSQVLPDADADAQQLTVDDQTGSGVGWRVTVAATNFVNGNGYFLPASGVLDVNGSVTSLWTPATPTVSCLGTAVCTMPDDSSVTYPVVISSAASSPVAATVFDAQANTGSGPFTIGGSAAVNPLGWWVSVPGNAQAGTYTATVTVSLVSGP